MPAGEHKLDPRTSWTGFLLASGLGLIVLFCLLRPSISSGLSGVRLITFWVAHVAIPLAIL